jgi:hypothetical protein
MTTALWWNRCLTCTLQNYLAVVVMQIVSAGACNQNKFYEKDPTKFIRQGSQDGVQQS